MERNCESPLPYPELSRPRLAPRSFDPLESSCIPLIGRTSIPPRQKNCAMIYTSENILGISNNTVNLSYPKRTFHALKEITGNVDSVGYVAPDLVRSVTVQISFSWVRQSWKSFDKDWMQLHNWKNRHKEIKIDGISWKPWSMLISPVSRAS